MDKMIEELTQGLGSDIASELSALMLLPDEHFNALAPALLEEITKSLNSPSSKIALAQMLKDAEFDINGFQVTLEKSLEEINQNTQLSNSKKDFLKGLVATLMTSVVSNNSDVDIVALPYSLCRDEAKSPVYAHVTDSGMDLYACDDITINPGETVLVSTGVKVAIPQGYELQVRPKSGRALKTKLRVANSPGTIDAGYRDEIKVIIENVEAPIKDISYHFDDDQKLVVDSIEHGRAFNIEKGDKFAQMVLMKIAQANLVEFNDVANIGEDRGGGFGSTGVK